jgi:hypothetical protein
MIDLGDRLVLEVSQEDIDSRAPFESACRRDHQVADRIYWAGHVIPCIRLSLGTGETYQIDSDAALMWAARFSAGRKVQPREFVFFRFFRRCCDVRDRRSKRVVV